MKKILSFLVAILFSITAFSQEYRPYLNAANDSAFKDKIKVAAYFGAKANVTNPATTATVKRFSQVVITHITRENPDWLVPLAFVILTVPELNANVPITTSSTQAQINAVMNAAYSIFAKAWYRDVL